MSLLQNLQSVYFDTLRLEEYLDRLPALIATWPVRNSTNGRQTVTTFAVVRQNWTNPLCSRLHQDLEILRKNLVFLEIDLLREIERLDPDEISEGLEPHLFILQKEVSSLHTLIDQIEICLPLLEEIQANEPPDFIHHNNIKLRRSLTQLEKIVCSVYGSR